MSDNLRVRFSVPSCPANEPLLKDAHGSADAKYCASALREAVANLYNVSYRQGKKSQYTYENVCIVPGGRAGLSRIAAVISNVYCVSDFVLPSSFVALLPTEIAIGTGVSNSGLHGVRSGPRRVQETGTNPYCVSGPFLSSTTQLLIS